MHFDEGAADIARRSVDAAAGCQRRIKFAGQVAQAKTKINHSLRLDCGMLYALVDESKTRSLDLEEATRSSKSEDETDGCTDDGKPKAPLKVCRYHPQDGTVSCVNACEPGAAQECEPGDMWTFSGSLEKRAACTREKRSREPAPQRSILCEQTWSPCRSTSPAEAHLLNQLVKGPRETRWVLMMAIRRFSDQNHEKTNTASTEVAYQYIAALSSLRRLT